jgi:hypothetical protein
MIPTNTENLNDSGLAGPERQQVEAEVARTVAGPAWKVDQRLAVLDHEWPLERVLNAILSAVVLFGTILAGAGGAAWLWLAGIAAALILLHSVTGWSPGISICQACGLRKRIEIERERYTLKALRGDFHNLAGIVTPHDREALERFEDEGGAVTTWTAPDAADPNVVQEALRAVER